MSDAVSGAATILVVEDNVGLRLIARRQLEMLGYQVHEAGDVADAMALLQGSAPVDLLFTDLIFPGVRTGQDLAREARRLRADLRVLFTSGFADGSVRHDLDGAPLLGKPYSRAELDLHVRRALGGATETEPTAEYLEPVWPSSL